MIKFRRQIGWTLACLVAGAVGASSAAAACGLRPITVDASQPVGVIRSLQGVSGTPLPGDASHPDFTSQFHQLGVDIVRTHDVKPDAQAGKAPRPRNGVVRRRRCYHQAGGRKYALAVPALDRFVNRQG